MLKSSISNRRYVKDDKVSVSQFSKVLLVETALIQSIMQKEPASDVGIRKAVQNAQVRTR